MKKEPKTPKEKPPELTPPSRIEMTVKLIREYKYELLLAVGFFVISTLGVVSLLIQSIAGSNAVLLGLVIVGAVGGAMAAFYLVFERWMRYQTKKMELKVLTRIASRSLDARTFRGINKDLFEKATELAEKRAREKKKEPSSKG